MEGGRNFDWGGRRPTKKACPLFEIGLHVEVRIHVEVSTGCRRIVDGQTIGQTTGEFVDGQTIGQPTGEFVDGQTIGQFTGEFVDSTEVFWREENRTNSYALNW